jgi:exopolysaccharide production protein ExoZ
MATAPETRINSLQAGRALAAMAVVCLHAYISAEAFAGSMPLGGLLQHGYLGVDFFFVLSGFIIYHSTAGRGKGWARYAESRARRIYLPYLPIGIAVALLYSLGLGSSLHPWGWFTSLTLAPVRPGPALSVAWTLQHEVLFYTVFGLLYFGRVLFAGLAIWAGAIIAAAALDIDGGIPLALINLEFVMGIGSAILASRRWGPNWLWLLATVPFGIWIVLGAEKEHSILVGATFALLILPIVRLETAGRFSVPNWLVYLGGASYAIYLIHNPLLSVIARVGADLGTVPLFILGVIASTAAGSAYYTVVEKRLARLPSVGRMGGGLRDGYRDGLRRLRSK